jgi:transcriptional regulator with XRE-family HTH domain
MHSFESPKFIEEKIIMSLKMTRKGKGLTQYDLAKRMNVSRDTIARLESGRSRATLVHVINIARILDVSLDKILSDVENPNPLDSSLDNVGNKSYTYLPNNFVENSNVVYNIEKQKGAYPNAPEPQFHPKKKINPFLTAGAIEHYGAEMETFILSHKSLWWWVQENDLAQLSIASVVEAILNFGGDEDIAKLFKLVSMEKVSKIFKAANQGSRTNYKPEIVSYYNQYFKKHVPGYTH